MTKCAPLASPVNTPRHEGNGNDEMSKCQPVGAVKDERRALVQFVQRPLRPGQPERPTRRPGLRGGIYKLRRAGQFHQPVHLTRQRNGGRPAEHEADDEKPRQGLDSPAQNLFAVHNVVPKDNHNRPRRGTANAHLSTGLAEQALRRYQFRAWKQSDISR